MSRYKTILDPTEEATRITKSGKTGQLFFTLDVTNAEELSTDNLANSVWENQHIYVVDKEADIKAGDLLYSRLDENIWKMTDFVDETDGFYAKKHSYKVIASTDTSLGLPELHSETIERYCNNPELEIVNVIYNVGKIVDGKWGNFTNVASLEEAKENCQQSFDKIRLMLFFKESKSEAKKLNLALEWWESLDIMTQGRYVVEKTGNVWENLSLAEIEEIYEKDKHTNCVIIFGDGENKESEVDFDLLKTFIDDIEGHCQDAPNKYQESLFRNLQLFFEKLKESPDFAILVHKKIKLS